ncbi:MAG: NADH-quinone oxidoreductase subunit K [Bacteroidales bacterium]|nr:NADH-quinone oxidoreductase subunit K [Bacteroidales bacterium]MBN2821307.1 NADH-quinone oxidoreductase subunit K [Bacteroidales bacterium]
MEILLAILTGLLFAVGVYLILRRSIIKFIIGIIFLSNATNLLVFLSAGLVSGKPVFVPGGEIAMQADPLPQALVLTAIVIGFGIVVFTIALKYKFFKTTGTDDLDQLQQTDK